MECSANVFAGLGFTPAAATVLTIKSTLIDTLGDTIKERNLTQQEAATLCGTDQPTLSKILRGRMESVTIDKLTEWLAALGHTVVIRVHPTWDVAAENLRDMIKEKKSSAFDRIDNTITAGYGKIPKSVLRKIMNQTHEEIYKLHEDEDKVEHRNVAAPAIGL